MRAVAVGNHSERQSEILRKIGIDVWKFRAVETASVAASVAVDTPESPKLERREEARASPAATAQLSEPAGQPESMDGDAGHSLESLEQAVSVCRKCELHQSRTHTVFGCGSPDADWLFVGEAPGHNEDLQGQPFVGRAGKLLDMMIAALGMKREQVFIANVLKCRPPNNRDPQPGEIEQCEFYLHQQLALIKPKVIVALGRISAQALLKTSEPLGKLRGRVYQYGADNIPLVATYHPAYLLRSPEEKAKAWEDLWQARMIVRQ